MKEEVLDLIYRLKAGCIASEMRIMEEIGLSPAEYNGIAAINAGECISGSAVSRKMQLSPSRGSRVIDKMVKNGYLVRKNDEADRRKCTVTLAPKGVDIKEKIDTLKLHCDTRIRERLSEKEMEAFTDAMKKVVDVI